MGHNCRQSTVVCLEFCELEPFQGANKLISTSDDVRAVSDSTDAEITADVAGVEGSDPRSNERLWCTSLYAMLLGLALAITVIHYCWCNGRCWIYQFVKPQRYCWRNLMAYKNMKAKLTDVFHMK